MPLKIALSFFCTQSEIVKRPKIPLSEAENGMKEFLIKVAQQPQKPLGGRFEL